MRARIKISRKKMMYRKRFTDEPSCVIVDLSVNKRLVTFQTNLRKSPVDELAGADVVPRSSAGNSWPMSISDRAGVEAAS